MIYNNTPRNSIHVLRNTLFFTSQICAESFLQESQKLPSDIDSQHDLPGSEESNGELRSAPQAKKRPGRQPGQSLSY